MKSRAASFAAEGFWVAHLDAAEAALSGGRLDEAADWVTRAAAVDRWNGTMAWHQRQRLKIERGLVAMAQELGEREFCYGNAFSLADIAAGYALGYVDLVLPDVAWRATHPNLARLAERLAQRESFQKTLPHT